MSTTLARTILEDFLKNSWPCIQALVKQLLTHTGNPQTKTTFFHFKNGHKNHTTYDGGHFFLRASVEYSNPQLTVEEVQGIVAARLLEACGNHFYYYGLDSVDQKDTDEICETLTNPTQGIIVPFLLNTDEIEPDRYSMNPLKESIVNTGQSAYPCATVKNQGLEIDQKFAQKYDGSLICKEETEIINRHLHNTDSYVDMVDAVKYEQLEKLSKAFGINLTIHSLRMPLTTLQKENTQGLLHHIIKETHTDYQSVECVYKSMGRSMKNLTTLLTVPHSTKGYASKRAAKGRIYFEQTKLKNIKVDYRTTLLYPNAIDPGDTSVAKADDTFTVPGQKLADYNFKETPSSPQFFLYSLASPENAVLWHGIGAFGASELLKSYTTTRLACAKNLLIKGLNEKYGINIQIPPQFNLIPKHMWFHPVHRNIDASIGCIKDLQHLAHLGMRMEHLQTEQYIRKQD
jgi:hypothetical protein